MTLEQIIWATSAWAVLTAFVFNHTGWKEIRECFAMWFTREYWTDYNTVEFVSWAAKALIIIPGLIFGIQIWQLYFLTLFTSLTLIWASNKKLLPTLVAFNSLWVWLSCTIICKNLF